MTVTVHHPLFVHVSRPQRNTPYYTSNFETLTAAATTASNIHGTHDMMIHLVLHQPRRIETPLPTPAKPRHLGRRGQQQREEAAAAVTAVTTSVSCSRRRPTGNITAGTETREGKPPPPRSTSCAPAAAQLRQEQQKEAEDGEGARARAGAIVGGPRQSGLTACALCAALSSTSSPSFIMRMVLPGVGPVSRSKSRPESTREESAQLLPR